MVCPVYSFQIPLSTAACPSPSSAPDAKPSRNLLLPTMTRSRTPRHPPTQSFSPLHYPPDPPPHIHRTAPIRSISATVAVRPLALQGFLTCTRNPSRPPGAHPSSMLNSRRNHTSQAPRSLLCTREAWLAARMLRLPAFHLLLLSRARPLRSSQPPFPERDHRSHRRQAQARLRLRGRVEIIARHTPLCHYPAMR